MYDKALTFNKESDTHNIKKNIFFAIFRSQNDDMYVRQKG